MKTPRQKIQQLFTLKPSRAVDLIFSQQKIDQIHTFYSNLQEHKKNNTVALKQTLQNNYEKMLYCSDLLDQVRKYAEAVKEVAGVIEDKMGPVQGKTGEGRDRGILERVQGLMARGRFGDAMGESFGKLGEMNREEKYFIFYSRIEIVNKMERHICLFDLDPQKIEEYSKCLHNFIFQSSIPRPIPRKSLNKWVKDFPFPSILNLIHKRISKITEIQSENQAKALIYEILFEYKLSTLRNKFKSLHSSEDFQKYFQELAMIIKLYRNVKAQVDGNLRRVFVECTKHVKSQLASIFISKLSTGEIVFKCELYEQLIKSERFEAIIANFYKEISEGSSDEVENPLNFIKELWHNYFINLIDVFLDQSNPLDRLGSLKQHSLNYESIPDELKTYVHDYSLEQSLHIITEYEQKLKLLNKTLAPIVKNCTEPQRISFQEKFNQKIEEITEKCVRFADGLEQELSTLALRKFLLLKILSAMLSKQIKGLNTDYKVALEEKFMDSKLEFKNPRHFWNSFAKKYRRKDSISSPILDFDCFFIGYLQGVHTHLKDLVSEVISSIAMQVLICVQEEATGKEKDKMTHTVQSLQQKKEKITILDTIAVPYLAKSIFKCSMKPICIDKQFYDKNLISKPVKPIIKAPEAPIDDFQIGQKQQKQQLVKVNIGKSIISLGNNLITGFMKKK